MVSVQVQYSQVTPYNSKWSWKETCNLSSTGNIEFEPRTSLWLWMFSGQSGRSLPAFGVQVWTCSPNVTWRNGSADSVASVSTRSDIRPDPFCPAKPRCVALPRNLPPYRGSGEGLLWVSHDTSTMKEGRASFLLDGSFLGLRYSPRSFSWAF
jgi:hypothetical protein